MRSRNCQATAQLMTMKMMRKSTFSLLLLLCTSQSLVTAWQHTLQSRKPALLQMSTTGNAAASNTKVTVVGGTGFVGSRVCKLLASTEGVSVTSVSKSGKIPAWCADESWTGQVVWNAADLVLSSSNDALDSAIGSPDAIVSCVGVVGTDAEELLKGNGAANQAAFASAERGGNLKLSCLVSVSEEVAACQENWLPDFFSGYFNGKKMAEQSALECVGGDATKVCIIKPTFIYGGDSFGLLPPRVNYEYGSGVEELLSTGLFKFLADVTPGLIKVALRPPVSVDSVAAAAAAAALAEEGAIGKTLEGTVDINAATNQPAATGLSEALEWAKENLIKAYDWAKVEAPKAIDSAKEAIEKMQQ